MLRTGQAQDRFTLIDTDFLGTEDSEIRSKEVGQEGAKLDRINGICADFLATEGLQQHSRNQSSRFTAGVYRIGANSML